jgi:hypothetical protein
MHLDGLEIFFSVFAASHELQQPKMTRSQALYRLEGSSLLLLAFTQKSIKRRLNRLPPSV